MRRSAGRWTATSKLQESRDPDDRLTHISTVLRYLAAPDGLKRWPSEYRQLQDGKTLRLRLAAGTPSTAQAGAIGVCGQHANTTGGTSAIGAPIAANQDVGSAVSRAGRGGRGAVAGPTTGRSRCLAGHRDSVRDRTHFAAVADRRRSGLPVDADLGGAAGAAQPGVPRGRTGLPDGRAQR